MGTSAVRSLATRWDIEAGLTVEASAEVGPKAAAHSCHFVFRFFLRKKKGLPLLNNVNGVRFGELRLTKNKKKSYRTKNNIVNITTEILRYIKKQTKGNLNYSRFTLANYILQNTN